MKKFIAPVIGLVAVLGLFAFDIDTTYAQLGVNPQDVPSNITSSTSFGGSLKNAIRDFLNFFLFFLSIVTVAMVIYGGFLYITAGGDDGGAEKGKKILTQAAIGIIIILISAALVNTLLTAGSGVPPV